MSDSVGSSQPAHISVSQTREADVRDDVCGSAARFSQLTHVVSESTALKISLKNNHSELF